MRRAAIKTAFSDPKPGRRPCGRDWDSGEFDGKDLKTAVIGVALTKNMTVYAEWSKESVSEVLNTHDHIAFGPARTSWRPQAPTNI